MKLKIIIPFLGSLILAAITTQAAHVWEEPRSWANDVIAYDHKDHPLFSANEISLDLGGTFTAAERGVKHLFETSLRGHRGEWGGDVGVNYFVTRYIGLGADINMPNNGGHLVDAALGSLIVRFPLGNSGFAPYLLGGAGRITEPTWEWVGQGGLGLEFRFNHNVGLFTDGRYLWPKHSSEALILRAGIRIAL